MTSTFGLGFDPGIGRKQILPNINPRPVFGPNPTEMDKTSVVAEIDPHTRDAKWTFCCVGEFFCRASKSKLLDNS